MVVFSRLNDHHIAGLEGILPAVDRDDSATLKDDEYLVHIIVDVPRFGMRVLSRLSAGFLSPGQ